MNAKMEKLQVFRETRERILQRGQNDIERQHKSGKLTARERIDKLLDPGTFEEIDRFVQHRCTYFGMAGKEIPGDAVIVGAGKINGCPVFISSQDYTVLAGTYGEMHGKKICKVLDLAGSALVPFLQINDSGGARLQEGQDSSEWYARLFFRHTYWNGVIPQITISAGHSGGGAAYGPALTDFIIQVDGVGYMYMGGPAFVKTQLREEATVDELGGAELHSKVTGLCDILAEKDEDALQLAKELLSLLPRNNREKSSIVDMGDDPKRLIEDIYDVLPDSVRQPYDMHEIIKRVVDKGYFFEIKRDFAPNMITGLARLDGQVIGIVANNPRHIAGAIDYNASDKLARFVRICDSFNIPLLQFQDSPAVMIGSQQERNGIIRHGSKMLYAYSEATVPVITVVIRKSYAGAQLCMANKPIGADYVVAWPSAEIALVGPETASSVIYAKEIKAAENPAEVKESKEKEYADIWINPYRAAERGYIDDIIEPRDTRRVAIHALEMLNNKTVVRPWRKHANMQM